jgi:hypothetical protein
MTTPEAERPEFICFLCERPAGRVMTFVPLCLRCRTAGYERVAAAETQPITVFSNQTGLDCLIQDSLMRAAGGLPARPLGAA